MIKYKIRFATKDDVKNIMDFIRNEWSENSILANDYEIFKFQYIVKDEVCFAIAENENTKEILGILGYIPYSNEEKRDVCTALWKVKEVNIPLLGIQILKYIYANVGCRVMASCGLNTHTISLYDRLRFKTGVFSHYYKLNEKDEYKICKINKKINLNNQLLKIQYDFEEIENYNQLVEKFDVTKYKNRRIYKDEEFLKRRYIDHPVYKYKIYGIKDENNIINSIIIGREQKINSKVIFRIVDFIGNEYDINYTNKAFNKLIEDKDYEYIDFYEYGIKEEILNNAGFILNREEDGNIIPNYFEPFVQKNVEISFYTSDDENFYMFKGDADQDRPNKR